MPVGMTTAAKNQMKAAAPVVMRNPDLALRASLALEVPFHPVVEEPQRASLESPAVGMELGRLSICRLGRPSRSG